MHTKTLKTQENMNVPNTPMRYLFHVAKPHRLFLILTLLSVTAAEVASTSIPYVFRMIVDTANAAVRGDMPFEDIWVYAIAYPLILAFVFLAWRTSGLLGLELVTRSGVTSYKILFSYLTQHSHSYFSDRFAGSLSGKVNSASDGVRTLSESIIWNYYPTFLSLIFTFFYLFFANAKIGLVFLALIIVLIPVNIAIVKYRRPHIVRFAEHLTRAKGNAVDAISNIAAIRQFSRRADEEERFGAHINEMARLDIQQSRISEYGLMINNAIIVLFEAVILLFSVQSWIAGSLTVGELVMITALLGSIQGSLTFIGSSMNSFIRRFSDIQEGLTDILVEHEIVDESTSKPLAATTGKIEWQNVDFKYGENSVFSDFNLTIKPGQRVGLVGQSGAGKTTFVSLLLRQHNLTGGAICIDGQNIAEVTQDSLRENITIVPQEPMLFHRSIRENIAYGKPDATMEEIIAVVEKAQAHEFISKLAEGYDTLVGERGVKLSGGQKQRVAIARAMLKDAPILVLDEATSALDSESEVAIQKALHALMEGKTVIAIAHRLSTLREMDRIIVLDTGKIVEDGTHKKLTKAGGMYARLWEHQAGGFIKD
jgi:ATP-binding cassette subfamily B protein